MKRFFLLIVCVTMMVASNALNLPKKVNHVSKATLQIAENSAPHLPISPVASKPQTISPKVQSPKTKAPKSLMAKQQVMANAVSGPKKNVAEGVFYTRPEGSFAYGWDKEGMGYYNSYTLVAPYKEFELVNQCTNKGASTWKWADTNCAEYINQEGNFVWSQDGAAGYYMPTVASGTTQYTWAQTDNNYGDNYKSSMRCADAVAPFTLTDPHMGPDYIGWGFLSSHFLFGDGQLANGGKNYQCYAVEQSFPKPMSPLYVEDIYISLLNLNSNTFLKAGEELTLDIVNTDGEVLYTLTAGANDIVIDEDDPYDTQYGYMRFATAFFSMKDIDPLTGDVAAVPFVLDEAFTVVISGFEGKNIGFRGHFMMDDNDIDTAEAAVVDNGYLDFYNVSDESDLVSYTFQNKIAIPMTFTAMFDAAQVWTSAFLSDVSDFNVLKISADGKAVHNAGYPNANSVYVNTASSWFDENGTELYYLADAHDEFPEWLAYGVDNSNWKNHESEDFEPTVYVGFTADPLPAGVTGRGVKLYVNGRGIVSEDPIYILQGNFTKAQCDAQENSSSVKATSLTFTESSVSMHPGESHTIDAIITPENATIKTLNWTSSNANVATVDQNGVVSAISIGSTTITATTKDGTNLKATCAVTVEAIPVTSVTLNKHQVEMEIGSAITLNATVLPENATNKDVTWSSSNSAIATVNANGVVKGINTGTVTITATSKDGSNKSDNCVINVNPIYAESITLTPSSANVDIDKTITLTTTILPQNATYQDVAWSSSDASIATVSDGVVKGIKAGNATIYARTTDGTSLSATCSIEVNPMLASSITLDHNILNLNEGNTATLIATVLPEKTTNKNVVWTSSDESVASVLDGVVTALKIGQTTITAKTIDGSNLSALCVVNVNPILATSITLNKQNIELFKGENTTLTATVLPENATYKDVVWSSDNEDIAHVVNGVVYALEEGTTTITARTTDGSNLVASCVVTVNAIYVTSIILNETSFNVEVGSTYQLFATVLPNDATNSEIEWTSSNETTATVEDGLVTGVNVGVSIITAKATDGSNVMAQCVAMVQEVSGIFEIHMMENVLGVYTLDGKKVEKINQGVYIIRMKDGTTKKIIAK